MSDAFIICTTKNSKTVEAELKNKGLKASKLSNTETGINIFRSNGHYFENNGSISNATIVLSSEFDYPRNINKKSISLTRLESKVTKK